MTLALFISQRLVVFLVFGAMKTSLGQVQFHAVGLQPDGTQVSFFTGASADGTVLCGTSLTPSPEVVGKAIRWSVAGGTQRLGDLGDPASGSECTGISADGSVIVGMAINNSQPFRWTAASGMMPLSGLAGVTAISHDGGSVVGAIPFGPSPQRPHPAVQDASGTRDLGTLVSEGYGYATGVNADGSVVVDWARDASSVVAFRWTSASGMVSLGQTPTGVPGTSQANAVNADGSVVAGWFEDGHRHAYRWTSSSGMVPFGVGSFSSEAHCISDNGQVIGGDYLNTNQFGMLWTPQTGAVDARSFLIANGATGLDDYRIAMVSCVSGDGRVIAGSAIRLSTGRYEGWYAVIPSPGSGTTAVLAWVLVTRRRRQIASSPWQVASPSCHYPSALRRVMNGDARGRTIAVVPVPNHHPLQSQRVVARSTG